MAHNFFYSSTKVAIIGAGFVGSTTAYALMMGGVASEIALIDINKDKAEGEALDLSHCTQFTQVARVVSGDDFSLVKDASVVVIAAGVSQKPGETRSDLLSTNVKVFKDIISKIVQHNKECILLVVTNPLDVLTYVSWKLSGFPSCRVLGAGTVLDTARLRYLISNHFKISSKDITAYILGEHGDSEFMWLSGANIAGVPLTALSAYEPVLMKRLCEETKKAAGQIINKKGATYYAIALVVAKIIKAILLDQSRIFTVSALVEDVYGIRDVCLGLPTVVRKGGVCERLPLELNEAEQEKLKNSAQKIRSGIEDALKLL